MKTVGPGCVVAALLLGAQEAPPGTGWVPTRRAVLHAAAASLLTAAPSLAAAAAVTAATDGSASGRATSALDIPFDWSFAYGGGARIGARSAPVSAPKRTGLTTEAIASELRRDLSTGKYILTGDLTAELFRDECHFEDPNNAVDGLQKYRQALSLLFDPDHSELRVGDVKVTGPKTIEADYVASGTLKLPWRPRISPWSGHITYTLDEEGLVRSQVDVWNITRWDAIRQTFTPT